MSRRPVYQSEPTWLHSVAWQQGYLSGLEVLRIAAWKSAKSLAWLTLNSETEFREATAAVMDRIRPMTARPATKPDSETYWEEWGEAAAWAVGTVGKSGLMRLSGVRFRMASAILCILDPEVWPVIDKWALDTVSLRDKRNSGRWYGWRGYSAFTRHLAEHGPTYWRDAKTIHDLDQCAMNASDPKRPETVPAGFPTIPPPPRRRRSH